MKVKDAKLMIRNEVASWALYDQFFHQEVAKAEKERLKPRRSAKRRLPFTGITPKKARDTGPKASTGPKVRVVTKLSKLKNRRLKLSKQISKGLWARKKLETDEEFLKSLARKPKKLIEHMLEVLSHHSRAADCGEETGQALCPRRTRTSAVRAPLPRSGA